MASGLGQAKGRSSTELQKLRLSFSQRIRGFWRPLTRARRAVAIAIEDAHAGQNGIGGRNRVLETKIRTFEVIWLEDEKVVLCDCRARKASVLSVDAVLKSG